MKMQMLCLDYIPFSPVEYEEEDIFQKTSQLKIGNFKMGIGIAEKTTKQEGIAGVVM